MSIPPGPTTRAKASPIVGRILQDGYRERVALATKMPSWLIEKREDFDYYFFRQLERLQTDHIDFYLLHTLNQAYWDNYVKLKVFDWAEKQLADGRIRKLGGFSFHDHLSVFEQILNGYDHWSFCQIQYNYMDVEFQAGQRGLKMAAERGLGVVIMEPLRGGSLAKDPLPLRSKLSGIRRCGLEAGGMGGLAVALESAGGQCGALGHVNDGARERKFDQCRTSGVNSLSAEQCQVMKDVQQAWKGLAPVACTHCEYCLPCPNGGVQIPQIFEIYNNAVIYDNQTRGGQRQYQSQIPEEGQANNCVECGACESLCPQALTIIDYLKDAHAYLGEG